RFDSAFAASRIGIFEQISYRAAMRSKTGDNGAISRSRIGKPLDGFRIGRRQPAALQALRPRSAYNLTDRGAYPRSLSLAGWPIIMVGAFRPTRPSSFVTRQKPN